ncbi:helix-turn-helix domain-containing protein [Chamaesiphon sp. GL140_3_metabinner_50]|uniref:helix-turn-helix domain-containing protein n=1 Tax=Chamaesiphon sp. GL140_3_metabinner_50 TaxID=2970812 RepID=UPI0025F59596|nr:helix-turn-helix domain-containing protein [Chamaesiphon sp. GL140_3_metabinner_50]
MAIVEITPDFSSLTTTDRLLESIRDRPDGITIKELADNLNRPISMLQICLKILIASRKVAVRRHHHGQHPVTVYISKPDLTHSPQQFYRSTHRDENRVTPLHLREVAGLTKLQLAIELGMSVRTIDSWEQKRSQPKLVPSQLKQMMSVYQCTIDELIAAFEQ